MAEPEVSDRARELANYYGLDEWKIQRMIDDGAVR